MRWLARSLGTAALVLVFSLLMSACSQIPRDSEGTADRVAGGTLRVGVLDYAPWAETDPGAGNTSAGTSSTTGNGAPAGEPTGPEPDLVRGFAEELGADVEWVTGSESELVPRLEDGQIDLLVGGLDAKTPYKQKFGLTRAYLTTVDAEGNTMKHVMAVKNGENAFLVDLETYLSTTDIPVPEGVEVKR